MRGARQAYHDESQSGNKKFTQDGAWSILKEHHKWDSIEPVDPVDLTGHAELFGDDPRPHVSKKSKSSSTEGSNPLEFANVMQNDFRLKREAAQEEEDEGILK